MRVLALGFAAYSAALLSASVFLFFLLRPAMVDLRPVESAYPPEVLVLQLVAMRDRLFGTIWDAAPQPSVAVVPMPAPEPPPEIPAPVRPAGTIVTLPAPPIAPPPTVAEPPSPVMSPDESPPPIRANAPDAPALEPPLPVASPAEPLPPILASPLPAADAAALEAPLPVQPPAEPSPVSASALSEVPAPEPRPMPAVAKPAVPDLALFLERGDALLATGDLTAARLFYQRAAERGDGRAATGVAKTYDPVFLEQAGFRQVRGDPAAAALWYRRAIAAGDSEAPPRLARLQSEFAAQSVQP